MTSIQTLIAKVLAFLAFCVVLVAFGWHYGSAHVQAKWDAQLLTDAQAEAIHVAHVDLVTGQVITQYVDRVQVVLTQGATITKEITRVITPEVDHRYPLPWGFVRLYNAAALGAIPDAIATGGADDASTSIALSDVAASINDNFTACHANAEQLRSVQQWIREQQALNTKKAP